MSERSFVYHSRSYLHHSTGETPLAAPSRPASYRWAVGPTPIASRAWFKRSQRILGRDWPTAYLFVGMTVFLLGTVKAYPFLRALWYSFHNVVGFRVGDFVGLNNYIALWGDDRFTRSVGVTRTRRLRTWLRFFSSG